MNRGEGMRDISSIFDYFKKAFHLNKSNKELYYPQIAFILVKASMFVIFGVMLYQFVMDVSGGQFTDLNMISYVKSMAWWGIALLLILGLGSVIMEAGLFNMYKKSLSGQGVTVSDFRQGVSTYFFKMLLASIMMILIWLIILIPYMIIGFITLFTGFFIIPLIIGIFTAMWKVSIVMDDLTVLEGFRKGFAFAKDNFKALTALIIVKTAFLSSTGGSGGSGGNSGSNFNNNFNGSFNGNTNTGNSISESIDIPDFSPAISGNSFEEVMQQVLPYIKTGFYVLIPVITIAIIIGALVKMVFEIFFNLSIFVMYDDIENNKLTEEAIKLKKDPLASFDMEVK